ncbi:MAG: DUF503 domain-containing protein [Caldilineae bacterium]|nr:MAG: DUF503 domain-containing protein [Caldilineae bacterium]
MVIASAVLELDLPGSMSLKDKRRVVKSVLSRLRRDYNLAAAEVGAQDERTRALIALVTVCNESGYAHGLLEKAIAQVSNGRLDCVLADYEIEIW